MADADHILINMISFGRQRIFLENLEAIDWPPPERIYMDDETKLLRASVEGDEPAFIFKRISISQLTDEQIAKCPGIARGAEYVYEQEIN